MNRFLQKIMPPEMLLPLAPALVFGLLVLVRAVTAGTGAGTAYTVATLQADLARSPRAWLDRPLRVDAVPTRRCVSWVAPHTSPCLAWYAELSDGTSSRAARPLPLASGGAPRALALLRRFPLVGWWLPAPQSPRWSVAAVYRIQIHSLPCTEPGWDSCYEAVLLDAAP